MVLNVGKRVSVAGVGLVQEHVEADCGESEVGNSNLLTSNILATIGGNSLLDCGNPGGQHLEPGLFEDGFLLLVGFKVELEVCVEVVLNGIDGGVNLPCGLGVLGVVSVFTAKESENSPGLDEELAVFGLKKGDLAELKLTFSLELLEGLTVDEDVLVLNLGVSEEESDGLSATVDVKVEELAHIF